MYGVFETLQKEKMKVKKERSKTLSDLLFTRRRRRHQKKVKQGEKCPRIDLKSYQNYYFNVV